MQLKWRKELNGEKKMLWQDVILFVWLELGYVKKNTHVDTWYYQGKKNLW